MRHAVCLIALLFCAALADAQTVVIRHQYRVPNTAQGCCGYASLETAALHQGYTQAAGLTAARSAMPYTSATSHPCHATIGDLHAQASALGIPVQSRPAGSYDTALIVRGVASGRGVVVTTLPAAPGGHGHAQVAVGWSAHRVVVVDPNVPGREVTYRRADFRWDGGSLLLGR